MGEIGAARAKFLRASSPRLAKKKGTQFLPGCPFVLCEGASSPSPKVLLQSIEVGCFAAYRENSLQSERLHFRQGEKPLFSGGWPFPGSLDFLFT